MEHLCRALINHRVHMPERVLIQMRDKFEEWTNYNGDTFVHKNFYNASDKDELDINTIMLAIDELGLEECIDRLHWCRHQPGQNGGEYMMAIGRLKRLDGLLPEDIYVYVEFFFVDYVFSRDTHLLFVVSTEKDLPKLINNYISPNIQHWLFGYFSIRK